ncbi:MAG: hypothetical protein JOY61_12750, partial [Chloroflexi bacterium]|nr:hypothetical protein [Chloroflexota bacterium]
AKILGDHRTGRSALSEHVLDQHRTVQIAFGWSGEHLHRFVIHGREHGAERVHLPDLGLRVLERFLYEYNFIDAWQHDVNPYGVSNLDLSTRLPIGDAA